MRIIRRYMLLFTTLILLVTLTTACMGSGAGSIGTLEGGSKRDGGAASEAVSNLPFPVDAGYFDKDFDYTMYRKFEVVYLIGYRIKTYLFFDFDRAFGAWAERMNIEYKGMHMISENSKQAPITLVQTYIDLGIDGIFFDGADDVFKTVVDMCTEAGVAIWRCMEPSRDINTAYMYGDTYVPGAIVYPFFNADELIDKKGLDRLIAWKDETLPEVPWDRVGLIYIVQSLSEASYKFLLPLKERWCEVDPSFGEYSDDLFNNPRNFQIADISTLGIYADLQIAAENLVTDIISANQNIEVWLIPTTGDVYAMGAADAIDKMGFSEKSCICSSFGIYDLSELWDTDKYATWRYASYLPDLLRTEPMVCALWALMAGQCTPETLWPQWVKPWDKGDVFEFEGDKPRANVVNTLKLGSDGKPIVIEEHSYAQALYPTNWIDREYYKEFFAWTDLYLYGDDIDSYTYQDYPRVYDINLYASRAAVPPDFYIN